MTDTELKSWLAVTQDSRYRWTEDEITRLNGRGALYYYGGEDGIYMRIQPDGKLSIGTYEGAQDGARMSRVASVSFGKDSLAMLLLLLEKEMPLDDVIFYDTGMEFQAIYDIRDRMKPVLEQRGIRFIEVKPSVPFLYDMLERPVNSKKGGFHLGYGWCGGPCRWGTGKKTKALDGLGLDPEKHYVGIAADEPKRLERLKPPKYALLANEGMTEADCLTYCYQRGFFWEENGVRLYDILDRVSCWCCKNKNRKELKALYQYLPQYWSRLKELQAQISQPMKPYCRKGVPYGSVFDLEKVFEQEIQAEASGSAPKSKRRRHEQSR